MKKRFGFVSNSSSSSFIISSKEPITKLSVVIEVDLSKMSNFENICTLEELNIYMKNQYLYKKATDEELNNELNDYPHINEIYQSLKSKIDSGETITCFSASNDSGSSLEEYFYDYGFQNCIIQNKDIKFIKKGD